MGLNVNRIEVIAVTNKKIHHNTFMAQLERAMSPIHKDLKGVLAG
jgi:hypothetical protein